MFFAESKGANEANSASFDFAAKSAATLRMLDSFLVKTVTAVPSWIDTNKGQCYISDNKEVAW